MNPDPCPRCNAYWIILQDLEDQKEVMEGLLRRQEQILDIRIRDEEPENRIQGNIGVIQYFEEEVRKFTDFQKAIHKIMDLTYPFTITQLMADPSTLRGISPFKKIHATSSGGTELREVQKTVQYFGTHLFELPQEMRRISLQNEEIITLLVDIQKSIKEMKIPASSSKERRHSQSIDICATPTGGIGLSIMPDALIGKKGEKKDLSLLKI